MTAPAAFDWGLLEPLGGAAAAASDDAVLAALVDVERALVLAWGDVSDDADEADDAARCASRGPWPTPFASTRSTPTRCSPARARAACP